MGAALDPTNRLERLADKITKFRLGQPSALAVMANHCTNLATQRRHPNANPTTADCS